VIDSLSPSRDTIPKNAPSRGGAQYLGSDYAAPIIKGRDLRLVQATLDRSARVLAQHDRVGLRNVFLRET